MSKKKINVDLDEFLDCVGTDGGKAAISTIRSQNTNATMPSFHYLLPQKTPAEAELARLTALLEDREAMAEMLFDYWSAPIPRKYSWDEIGTEQKDWLGLADRLIAYLKPLG